MEASRSSLGIRGGMGLEIRDLGGNWCKIHAVMQ